ncbi:hypothetical protein MLD38_016103 [Melastoma candidum]|uniref:Uncharacterized protein n=1 Tax=Melastoma candidum TaxID=119954 RepID=A0ACB9RRT6_9MYRT|nr:hypothetical protein MLD38_016103 [Melastoma candidum]
MPRLKSKTLASFSLSLDFTSFLHLLFPLGYIYDGPFELLHSHPTSSSPCPVSSLQPSARIFPTDSPPPPPNSLFLHLIHKGEVLIAKPQGKMSRRNGNAPKLDLRLNLSPPRANGRRVRSSSSPSRSATASPTSPPSSCVSSEANNGEDPGLRYSNSPEATSMVLAGCPRCLMYVMLSEEDPKCPKCKSPVMLDFLHDNGGSNSKGGGGSNSGRRNKKG